VQGFLSAAVGIAAAMALVRVLPRRGGVGNFGTPRFPWVSRVVAWGEEPRGVSDRRPTASPPSLNQRRPPVHQSIERHVSELSLLNRTTDWDGSAARLETQPKGAMSWVHSIKYTVTRSTLR
jgi:hypothetical protein